MANVSILGGSAIDAHIMMAFLAGIEEVTDRCGTNIAMNSLCVLPMFTNTIK
jgi:hypothetical protein